MCCCCLSGINGVRAILEPKNVGQVQRLQMRSKAGEMKEKEKLVNNIYSEYVDSQLDICF